jgi:hypothetical protein
MNATAAALDAAALDPLVQAAAVQAPTVLPPPTVQRGPGITSSERGREIGRLGGIATAVKAAVARATIQALAPSDPFVRQALASARMHVRKLNRMIREESDPARLDKLASALSRVSEIERKLANRPDPGQVQRRPEASRPANASPPAPVPVKRPVQD